MLLKDQIETLQRLGFRFCDDERMRLSLEVYEWWNYFETPFTLLLSRIHEETTWCKNVVSIDLKHLRSNGWYEGAARIIAEISDSTNELRVEDIQADQLRDHWKMKYSLRGLSYGVSSRFPQKYAPLKPILDMLPQFANEEMCFYLSRVVEFGCNDPLYCWLPRSSEAELVEILGDRITAIASDQAAEAWREKNWA